MNTEITTKSIILFLLIKKLIELKVNLN